MPYKITDIREKLKRHPTKKWSKRKKTKRIVVHNLGSENQDVYKTNDYHIGPNHISPTGCPRICYHYEALRDGTLYQCNDEDAWTWHCGALNRTSESIVLAINGDKYLPTEIQYSVLVEHLARRCLYYKLLPKKIRGHRELPGFLMYLGKGSRKYRTTCPGMKIDMNKLRNVVCKLMQTFMNNQGVYDGAIDGLFGRKSKKGLKAFVYGEMF